MDLSKFVSMLGTGSLHFIKVAKFHDPYEGFCTVVPQPDVLSDYRREHGVADGAPITLPTAEGVDMFFGNARHTATEEVKNAPNRVYVNSWCL
jgi:hypothetical protein